MSGISPFSPGEGELRATFEVTDNTYPEPDSSLDD